MSFVQDVRPNTGHELTLVRDYDAPRELVFRMWVEPEHMRVWSCPRGFTIPRAEGGSAKPGGSFRVTMQSPDGVEHVMRGTYVEVTPVSRIVFSHAWEQDDGQMSPNTTVDVRLDDLDGKTRLTLHQAFFDSASNRDGHQDGWSQSLEKLTAYLETQS